MLYTSDRPIKDWKYVLPNTFPSISDRVKNHSVCTRFVCQTGICQTNRIVPPNKMAHFFLCFIIFSLSITYEFSKLYISNFISQAYVDRRNIKSVRCGVWRNRSKPFLFYTLLGPFYIFFSLYSFTNKICFNCFNFSS